jgi:hypothetical protein
VGSPGAGPFAAFPEAFECNGLGDIVFVTAISYVLENMLYFACNRLHIMSEAFSYVNGNRYARACCPHQYRQAGSYQNGVVGTINLVRNLSAKTESGEGGWASSSP